MSSANLPRAAHDSGEEFDPYFAWLGISPAEQPASYYRLLGFSADGERLLLGRNLTDAEKESVENAADRQMSHLRRLQTGKRVALTQKLLNEVATARGCLLDQEKKAAYDRAQLLLHAATIEATHLGTDDFLLEEPTYAPQLVQEPFVAAAPIKPASAAPAFSRPVPIPQGTAGSSALKRRNGNNPTIMIAGGAAAAVLVIGGLIAFLFAGSGAEPPQQKPPLAVALGEGKGITDPGGKGSDPAIGKPATKGSSNTGGEEVDWGITTPDASDGPGGDGQGKVDPKAPNPVVEKAVPTTAEEQIKVKRNELQAGYARLSAQEISALLQMETDPIRKGAQELLLAEKQQAETDRTAFRKQVLESYRAFKEKFVDQDAQSLLTAAKSETDRISQAGLVMLAMERAARDGEAEQVAEAMETMDYPEITLRDKLRLKANFVGTQFAAKKPQDHVDARIALIVGTLEDARAAMEADDFDTANVLLGEADKWLRPIQPTFSPRVEDRAAFTERLKKLRLEIPAAQKFVQERAELHRSYRASLDADMQPRDPAAKRECAAYVLTIQGPKAWKTALRWLGECDDENLRKAATLELGDASKAENLLAASQAWIAAAGAATKPEVAKHWNERAGHCIFLADSKSPTGRMKLEVEGIKSALAAKGITPAEIGNGSSLAVDDTPEAPVGQEGDFKATELYRLKGHNGPVIDVAIGGNGLIATSGNDRTVRLWNPTTGREVSSLTARPPMNSMIKFVSGGDCLVAFGLEQIHFWSPATGQLMRKSMSTPSGAKGFDISEGASVMAFSQASGTVLIQTLSGESPQGFGGMRKLPVIAMAPEGARVLLTGDPLPKMYSIRSGTLMQSYRGNRGDILDLAFSVDGTRFACCCSDGSATVWNVSTGEVLGSVAAGDHALYSIDFSPAGDLIVAAGADKDGHVWDASTGEEVAVLEGHVGQISSVAFAPDGRHVLTGGEDATARVWRLPQRRAAARPNPDFRNPVQTIEIPRFEDPKPDLENPRPDPRQFDPPGRKPSPDFGRRNPDLDAEEPGELSITGPGDK